MHTATGTTWKGIPTQLDEISYGASISLVAAGINTPRFLVDGASRLKPSRFFVLSFGNAESVCAYEETVYWSLAEEASRPQHTLNLILETDLLSRMKAFRGQQGLFHFLICGADMCAEIVAMMYAIKEFRTREKAEQALAIEIDTRVAGQRLGISDWLTPDRA